MDLGRRRRSASSGGLDLGLLLRRRRFLQNRAPAAARRGRRGRRAGPADGPDGLSGLPDPGGEPQRAAAKGRHRLFAVGDDKLETANSCVRRREDDLDVGDEARSDLDVDDVVASLADLVDCWFVIRGGRVESKRVSAGRGRESLSSSPSNSKRSKLNTQKTQNSKLKNKKNHKTQKPFSPSLPAPTRSAARRPFPRAPRSTGFLQRGQGRRRRRWRPDCWRVLSFFRRRRRGREGSKSSKNENRRNFSEGIEKTRSASLPRLIRLSGWDRGKKRRRETAN